MPTRFLVAVRSAFLGAIMIALVTMPAGALPDAANSGHIAGRVISSTTHDPVQGLCVEAWSAHDVNTPVGDVGGPPGMGGTQPVATPVNLYASRGRATTDSQGRYRLSELPFDTYKLGFYGCGGEDARFVGEWYRDKPLYSFAEATTFVVDPIANEDSNAEVMPRTGITGRVLDELGQPLADVCVRPEGLGSYSTGNEFPVSPIGRSGVDGHYVMPGPDDYGPSGSSFKLAFGPCATIGDPEASSYDSQWWPQASTFETAETVHFQQGTWLHDLNARLVKKRP